MRRLIPVFLLLLLPLSAFSVEKHASEANHIKLQIPDSPPMLNYSVNLAPINQSGDDNESTGLIGDNRTGGKSIPEFETSPYRDMPQPGGLEGEIR